MATRKARAVAEFGDFQTPQELASQVVTLLSSLGVAPRTVVEPSCGRGAFLVAAAETYPQAHLIGLDINQEYVADARQRLAGRNASVELGSFFQEDWAARLAEAESPVLVLGNPPWVTNAELGTLASGNLPEKTNFQGLKGLDAIMGKSNFDISEWMLLQNIEWLIQAEGTLAVLCKTAVARKILASAWKRTLPLRDARIYRIDALAHFGAAVDACLFYVEVRRGPALQECAVYDRLDSTKPSGRFGFADGKVISNMDAYRANHGIYGVNPAYTWRSGVKHDCSKAMEFDLSGGTLTNGHGEVVDLEPTYLFPLFKSSDISGAKKRDRTKLVLVTQTAIGAETDSIRERAPKTWKYLEAHGAELDGRTSSIYRGKPRFSIFGVGDYTFAPWKIAISGLYKNLGFKLYGSIEGKPVCFDDTVYFLPFQEERHAKAALELFNSDEARSFLDAMIFWDEKRPITVEVLKRLDLAKLALLHDRVEDLGVANFAARSKRARPDQLSLLA